MAKIVELDDLIINKIAAGEVIERPTSVVKELVENAIDAKCTRIEIDVEEGGAKRIRVTDNGYGMVDADLGAAFKSHATSKLKTPDDLFRITTMGFRGEALPSIGAVSRARITTCYRGARIGAEIEMDAGRLGEVFSKGAPEGTTVEVRDLFFNTPVRRKFLRSTAAEMRAIVETVGRIALAHGHVAFLLRHNGRKVFSLEAGQTLKERVGELLERSIADELVPLEYAAPELSITGYAVKPSTTRSSANGQYIYLNGRFIRDRGIMGAIRTAYDGFLMVRRYPMVFLFLDINPAAVDVNVHPTKIEVRFRDGNAVYSGVVRALREALRSANLVASLQMPSETVRPLETVRQMAMPGAAPRPPHQVGSPAATFPPHQPHQPAQTPWRFLQVHNCYIVAETPEGIRVIDQHALHEKILYTRLIRSAGKVPVQRLLVPVTVSCTLQEWAGMPDAIEAMATEGFEVAEFGDRTVAVYAVPQLLQNADVAQIVRSAAGALDTAKGGVAGAREALLAMVSCKAAVKAGMMLEPDEIVELLDLHAQGDLLDFCPHGRPAVLDLSTAELDRQFGRT